MHALLAPAPPRERIPAIKAVWRERARREAAGGWPEAEDFGEHVRDRSFRIERHAGLLLTESLAETSTPESLDVDEWCWRALVELQSSYAREPWRPRASSFGRLVREADGP